MDLGNYSLVSTKKNLFNFPTESLILKIIYNHLIKTPILF